MASSDAADANPQPASRSGIAEGGAGTATGRTNDSSKEVAAPASMELTTPANRTPKPTMTMLAAPSQRVLGSKRAQADEDGADDAEPQLRLQAFPHGPGEIDQQQQGEGAEGGKGRELGIVEDFVAQREQHGEHDRRPSGAAQRS